SDSRMVASVPISTPLYSILVLPASSPSADLNVMVIFGPWLRIRVTATQTPATAAMIGTIQTTESRVRFLVTARDCGTCDVSLSAMGTPFRTGAIPEEPRIERPDGQHCENHDGGEEEQAGRGRDRHQRLQLDQCSGERVDEDVDHRPAADDVDEPV